MLVAVVFHLHSDPCWCYVSILVFHFILCFVMMLLLSIVFSLLAVILIRIFLSHHPKVFVFIRKKIRGQRCGAATVNYVIKSYTEVNTQPVRRLSSVHFRQPIFSRLRLWLVTMSNVHRRKSTNEII